MTKILRNVRMLFVKTLYKKNLLVLFKASILSTRDISALNCNKKTPLFSAPLRLRKSALVLMGETLQATFNIMSLKFINLQGRYCP